MRQKQIDLRARRIELGLTLEQLAMKIGMTAPMVRNIEVRAQKGSMVTRIKIADALKIPRTCLVSKEESEKMLELFLNKKETK